MISIINNNQFEYYPDNYVIAQKPFPLTNGNTLCIHNNILTTCYHTGWITDSITLDNFVFKIEVRARMTLSDNKVVITYGNQSKTYNINLNGNLADYFQFKEEVNQHVKGDIKVNIPDMSELSHVEWKVYYK